MTYDGLNRILTKSYSDGKTPEVIYTYDTGGATVNAIGRLITVQAGTQTYARGYDGLGRVISSTQSGYPAMAYGYNLANALTSFTFPSGRQQTVSYDNGNRAMGTTGTMLSTTTTYASGIGYWPNGSMQQMTTGAQSLAAVQQYCQNTRLQTTGVRVGSTSPWSLTTNCTGPLTPPAGDTLFLGITYGSTGANNGNVSSEQIVTSSSVNVTQNFSYDAYNRILTANEMNGSVQGWSQSYLYDAWGNRAVNPSGYILNGDLTPTATSQFTNNRWVPGSAYVYDGAGNQLSTGSKNSPGTVANAFTYDGENRLVTANIANTGNVSYVYDGEGRRVQKTVGTYVTNFVYDANGQSVTEYSNEQPTVGGTGYLFDDHLGSTRLFVNASIPGTMPLKRYDYVPFGEEIPSGMDGRGSDYGAQVVVPSSPDVVNQKFTGKERDAESGLDYFGCRYLSSAQGRWTSPDEPFADQHPEDPQSWNLYGYVRNNPLKNTDPNGKDCQNGVSACANYIAGGFGAVVNAFSSGLINAPNHIANALISLTGSSFRIGDAVQPAFTPANEEQQQGANAANAVMLVAPVAEAGAAALVEAVGTGTRVETGAAAATDVPTSIPAGPTARPTAAQQAAINEMGDAHGCNTCGTSNPGTQSGNWVGDHQPPTALNPPGGAQVYQPQCLQCSRQQGGQVAAAVKAAKKAACTTGSNGTTTCQ
jgi:RHS repeat-associated protein